MSYFFGIWRKGKLAYHGMGCSLHIHFTWHIGMPPCNENEKEKKRKSLRKSKRNYLKNTNQIQHLRFKIQRPIVGHKFWTSSIEIELTRSSLFFLLLFFFSKCLNLEDVLSVFFFRDPILVLVSSSIFIIKKLREFFL